ncbi:GAF domain-containing protein [Nocardia wallacei]|uniref:GAF domain-containing protein n=1 Tax=Nocardia wallacei TaxID=480035 RepID=UPI002453E98B|nr:GAF domain-containing protein [Nocardia wallacei]
MPVRNTPDERSATAMCLPAPRAVRPIETAGEPDCRRIAAAISAALPGRPAVGIAAVGAGRLESGGAASNSRAHLLEDTQLIHLGGPVRDAAAGGRPILVADMALETQWDNDFRREVQMLGARSLFCQPVTAASEVVGVITLCGSRPNAFHAAAPDLLRPFRVTVTDALIRLHTSER